jgi:hypothetical protein
MKSPALYIGFILVLLTLAYAAPLADENQSDGDSWSEITSAKGEGPEPAHATTKIAWKTWYSGHPEIAWMKVSEATETNAKQKAEKDKLIAKYNALEDHCTVTDWPYKQFNVGRPKAEFYDACVRCGDEVFVPQEVHSRWGAMPAKTTARAAQEWTLTWLYAKGKHFMKNCFSSGAFMFEDTDMNIFNTLMSYKDSPQVALRDHIVRGHPRITHACFMTDVEAESDQSFQTLEFCNAGGKTKDTNAKDATGKKATGQKCIAKEKIEGFCDNSDMPKAGQKQNLHANKGVIMFYHVKKSTPTAPYAGAKGPGPIGFTYVKLEGEYTNDWAHVFAQIHEKNKGDLPKRSEQEMKKCKPRSNPCYRPTWGVGDKQPEGAMKVADFEPLPGIVEAVSHKPVEFPDELEQDALECTEQLKGVLKVCAVLKAPDNEAESCKAAARACGKKKAAVVEEQLEEETEQWKNQDDQQEEEEEEEEEDDDEDEDEQDE